MSKPRTAAQKAKRRMSYPVRRKYPPGDWSRSSPANTVAYIKEFCLLNGPYVPATYTVGGKAVVI